MNRARIALITALVSVAYAESSSAKNDKSEQLPPGLEKKVARGEPLPPGWQKKLHVGDTLDYAVYHHGEIIRRDSDGIVTVSVDGRIIRVIENTREIIEILGL